MPTLASKFLAGFLSLAASLTGASSTPMSSDVQAPWRQAQPVTAPHATSPMTQIRSNIPFWRYCDGESWASSNPVVWSRQARPVVVPRTVRFQPAPVTLAPAPGTGTQVPPTTPAPAPGTETQVPPTTPAPGTGTGTQVPPTTPAPGTETQVPPTMPAPVPTTPTPVQLPAGLTADERQMVELVNAERTRAGLPPLQVDMRLVNTARVKSQDMIANNYFSHNSPRLGSPFDQIRSSGIAYRTAGENIAGNQGVDAAHNALMNSPGHRANILNAGFNRIGIGIVRGGRYGMMFTQQFIGV